MNITKNKKAFTLIEILIAVSILGILGTIGFISYSGYTVNARDSKRISDISLLKSSTLIYQKNNDGILPDIINSNSGVVFSGTLSNVISKQGDADDNFLAKLGISQKLRDPITNENYIYSVSSDKRFFQYTATLESNDNQIAYNTNLVKEVCAEGDCGKITAYVQGTFIPQDLHILPGLIYAFDYKNTNLDISNSNNLKTVVLNNQSINIAYNYSNTFQNCPGDIFSVNVGTSSGGLSTGLSCINSKGVVISHGTNDVIDLTGTTLNSQMGWKYKVCNNGIMDKNGVSATGDSDYYYSCKDLGIGALFDSTCHWTGCSAGYSVNPSSPGCIGNTSGVTLASPQNGAYQIPTSAYLSWYPSKSLGTGVYKVFLGSMNNSFEIINGISTSDTSMQFSGLNSGKMYFWKVQICDNLGANCKDSNIYSFTTSGDGSNSGNSGGSNSTTTQTYCPPGIICRADDVSINYVGCNSGNSSFLDCKKDDFGTSEKNGNDYFGVTKSIGYKIANNSDGIAKFNVQSGINSYINIGSAISFTDANAINLNGNNIGNNFYWAAGEGCLGNSISGYYISAKTSCYINFYFRGDPLTTTASTNIENIKIINNDKSNGSWPDTTINLNGKTSGYNLSTLAINMEPTKYKSALEPTVSTTSVDDFDTSTLDSNSKGYWKALVYNITNSNSSDAYFKPMFSDDFGEYNISPVNSTGGTDSDFSVPQTNIDIGNNGIGNIYYNNGDFNLLNGCGTYSNGLKVSANSNCNITIFFRADSAVASIKNNLINLKLSYQAVANQSSITSKQLFAQKSGGNTTLFTGYFPYSYNGWWIDFSTFQLDGDLSPSGFVRSQTMGWIDMGGTESGSSIKIYYDGTKKRIKGKTSSQTAGWIDFNKLNDPNTQTYIDGSGSIHGWARSQNYGWISFDNGTQQ